MSAASFYLHLLVIGLVRNGCALVELMGPTRLWPVAPPMVFELDMGVGDWAMAAAVCAGESRLLFFGLRGCCR